MKHLSVLQATRYWCARILCWSVLAMAGGAAIAQTTGAVAPGITPGEPAARPEMPPPGSCTPIGVTVSGEIVFPFQCKDFIDRMKASNQRPPSADKPGVANDQPAPASQRFPVAEDKSATDDKPVVADEKAVAPQEQPAPAEPNPAPAAAAQKAAAEPKPAIVEEAPAAEQKPVAAQDKPVVEAPQSAAVDDSGPAIRPGEKIPLPRRAAERPKELKLTVLCTHFRSYNAAAGTYKGFDGRVRSCH